MIVSTDVEKSDNPFTRPVKRVTPSGGNAQGELLEFLIDIDTDVLEYSDLEALKVLFDDLEWLHSRELNEALHFANKSSTGARSIARKWYSANRGRVAKLQMRLKKSKGLQAKKKVLAKSGRNLKKKKKKKYPGTKSHVNEYGFARFLKENHIGENLDMSDFKFKQAIRKRVDEMFESKRYRVVQEFTIGETEAQLLETFEHLGGGTWRLIKHNGQIWKFRYLEKKEIDEFIAED